MARMPVRVQIAVKAAHRGRCVRVYLYLKIGVALRISAHGDTREGVPFLENYLLAVFTLCIGDGKSASVVVVEEKASGCYQKDEGGNSEIARFGLREEGGGEEKGERDGQHGSRPAEQVESRYHKQTA